MREGVWRNKERIELKGSDVLDAAEKSRLGDELAEAKAAFERLERDARKTHEKF